MSYDLLLLLSGLALLAGSILPRLLGNVPITMPMVYLGGGMLLPQLWPEVPHIDPIEYALLIERIAEMAVLISLTAAGLKLDRELGWRTWGTTWRLLAVTMPLSIIALTLGGVWLTGLPLAAALLLAASAAPTDPVLAATVQVGPPGQEEKEHEVRFALTSEAGLNDGLAFPFVNLAIVLSTVGLTGDGLRHWLTLDLIWKIAAGTGAGLIVGWAVAMVVFRLCSPNAVGDSFVAIALTLLAYGATELIHGYGFIAVFVAALTFRRLEKSHDYHRALHSFSEQLEQLFMAILLTALGIAIAQGLFSGSSWRALLLVIGFLLLVRPLAGLLSLVRSGQPWQYRLSIAGLGIRGIGTFYYLSHGLNNSVIDAAVARELWAVAGMIVVASILLHGLGAPRVMQQLD